MANETSDFYSDPKVIVSILALVVATFSAIVSGLSLFWSARNQHEQNRRWSLLNAGAVELTKTRFIPIREISLEDYRPLKSDYAWKAYGSEASGRLVLIHGLRITNASSGEFVATLDPLTDLKGVPTELEKMKYKLPSKVEKVYTASFAFTNRGTTEVTNFHCTIDVQDQGNWGRIHDSSPLIRLAAGKLAYINCELKTGVQDQLPSTIKFKVQFSFTDVNGQVVSREETTTWRAENNSWAIES